MRKIETISGNTGCRHQLDRVRRFLDRREGDELPTDHPLVVRCKQLDTVTAEVLKNLGPIRTGPLVKQGNS